MKDKQDYIRDIAEVRSMMERSSKFLSLSGFAGIMAGIYALGGAYIAYKVFDFHPDSLGYGTSESGDLSNDMFNVMLLALAVLALALGTAIFLSHRNASKRGEKLWNGATRLVMYNMAVPLVAGGLLILILIMKGLVGLLAPCSLVFYGLALYSAGNFTYREVRSLGLLQILFGLLGAYFIGYGLVFWALGFGVTHIVYGIYMHYRYER
jgi:uncharacterized membrane protein YidH (DUF202 family)